MRGTRSGTLAAKGSSPRFSVSTTHRADRQIVAAREWWYEHRPAAPTALDTELQRAFRLLARHPRAGLVTASRLVGVRRLVLRRTRYALFYRVREPERRIEILALWHASRGAGPSIE